MTHSQYPPVVPVVSRSHEVLTCSRCGLVMTHDGHEYDEALIISFCAGFSSVFGDEMRVDAVFCQHCLSSIAGPWLRVTEDLPMCGRSEHPRHRARQPHQLLSKSCDPQESMTSNNAKRSASTMLKNHIVYLFAFLILVVSPLSQASGQNAAPFGMELGVATLAQVRQEIGDSSPLEDEGINKYTEGKMVSTDGRGLGVEGVQSVLFIFDKSEVLAGVIVTMPKDPVRIFKMLSNKYKVVSNKIDSFMNFGSARLEKGASVVEINAPHLSFAMEVRYLTKSFVAAHNRIVQEEAAEKERRKASAL